MREIACNIWNFLRDKQAFVCITTNNVLDPQGCLVMGAGTALEAKHRYPLLPKYWGREIRGIDFTDNNYPKETEYNLLYSPYQIIALQTKYHWKNPSPLDLVRRTIRELKFEAEFYSECKFVLPRLGCGHGGLDWENQVRPLCETLPDNCIIASNQ